MTIVHTPTLSLGTRVLERGEEVRIRGERGVRFRFVSLTTNAETGVTWVDVVEVFRGVGGVMRAFRLDRVIPLPRKRKARR